MDLGLADRTVLVTGSAGGIGQATARALASAGAKPLLHYHRSEEKARDLARELSAETEKKIAAFGADLRNESEVDAMFDEIQAHHGKLHGVVANAGIWVRDEVPLHEMTLAQWNETLDSDLTSAFLTCRGFLRALARHPFEDPSIVLVGSTAGLFGEANHADYSAAKAAMAHGLTASLKNEIVRLAALGRVNCVCPGWVLTPMAEQALGDPNALTDATRTVAMNKVATPEDIANSILYLSSPTLAGHISGTILPVHGGMEGRVLH